MNLAPELCGNIAQACSSLPVLSTSQRNVVWSLMFVAPTWQIAHAKHGRSHMKSIGAIMATDAKRQQGIATIVSIGLAAGSCTIECALHAVHCFCLLWQFSFNMPADPT